MAVRGCFGGGCSSWFVVLLLLQLLNMGAAVAGAGAGAGEAPPQLGANCGSIDACRGGVANDDCCKAINAAIVQSTCSSACRQLSVYNYPNLVVTCSQKSGCPMCRDCKCSSRAFQLDHGRRRRPYISVDDM